MRLQAIEDLAFASDQAFIWTGSSAFSKSAGQLRAVGSDGVVKGDFNGDGYADLTAYSAYSDTQFIEFVVIPAKFV